MFTLGNTTFDRVTLGYGGSLSGDPLYILTQIKNISFDISAEATEVKNKDGVIVYRKFTGRTGEVSISNAFMNFKIVETLSGKDAEFASDEKKIVVPDFKIIAKGEKLDITGYVDGTLVLSELTSNGSLGKTYKKGTSVSDTEFAVVTEDGKSTLTPPTDADVEQYALKYNREISSGAKISFSGNKFPKIHELYFKALAVDDCTKELQPVIIHIPSFSPSPEVSLAIEGGDDQSMEYKGSMLLNTCVREQDMFYIYYINEEETDLYL